MTLTEWRLAFRVDENAYYYNAGATVKEIKKELLFLNDTSNFHSPSKKSKERMTNKDSGLTGIVDFVGHVRTLPADLRIGV